MGTNVLRRQLRTALRIYASLRQNKIFFSFLKAYIDRASELYTKSLLLPWKKKKENKTTMGTT